MSQTEYQRQWYVDNRERILAKRSAPESREQINANARAYHARNAERLNARRRERHILTRYGLTTEAFEAMLDSRGGRCALCLTAEPARGWHIDHDHSCCPNAARSCGECIRGILCGRCNKGLGSFKDSPEILSRAIEYLRAER